MVIGLGCFILVAAIIWWFFFYSDVLNQLGGGDWSDAFSCLYSSGGECALVSHMAKQAGMIPYEPLALWVGVIVLGLGLILKFKNK